MSRIKIPFKINKAGLIELNANLNGVPGRFIIDTGASSCVLSSEVKEKFKIVSTENPEFAKGLGTSEMKNDISYSNDYTFQSTTLLNHPLIVLDLSNVNRSLEEHDLDKIDGIFGSDFLQRTNAAIYYSTSKIHLSI